MANLSTKSRKQQVLDYLRVAKEHLGDDYWVNTVDISNAEVGGSAGTSRIRDLRKEGYVIETRPHPDPQISQYQYRLVSEPDERAIRDTKLFATALISEPINPQTAVQEKVWD